jgi:hypothetical protein
VNAVEPIPNADAIEKIRCFAVTLLKRHPISDSLRGKMILTLQ